MRQLITIYLVAILLQLSAAALDAPPAYRPSSLAKHKVDDTKIVPMTCA